ITAPSFRPSSPSNRRNLVSSRPCPSIIRPVPSSLCDGLREQSVGDVREDQRRRAVDEEPDPLLQPVEHRLDLVEPPLDLHPAFLGDAFGGIEAGLGHVERLVEEARSAAADTRLQQTSGCGGTPRSWLFSSSVRKLAPSIRRHSAARSSASAGTLS